MDDFEDSLDDLIGGEARKVAPRKPTTFVPALERPDYSEGCPACRGTGFWRGLRDRPCFKCKGVGKRTFRSSPEARAKGRVRAAEKRVERESDKAVWRAQHTAEIEWLQRAAARNAQRGGTFDFPAKLLEGLEAYGTLTDGQLTAVQKLMARDAERAKARDEQRTSAIDATKIEAAFATARERAARPGAIGIWTKPLKLRARDMDLTFTPGSVGSQWEGIVFVKAASGEKLGAIKAGQFKRRFECTDAQTAAVIDACQDPAQAAVAFGKAWGICTVCGRTLTDDQSIARGIGPICADKYGW
jgi:hypothetical protein